MTKIAPVSGIQQLKQAFGCFPTGVGALCAEVDGRPVGLAASSLTSVSVDPPLVSVCMQHSSTTWPVLRDQPRLGVSVLAEGQDEICARLASKDGNRFEGTDWVTAPDNSVFVVGATLWLDCTLYAEVIAGDHSIVLLKVHGTQMDADTAPAPLVFHGSRFRRLATV